MARLKPSDEAYLAHLENTIALYLEVLSTIEAELLRQPDPIIVAQWAGLTRRIIRSLNTARSERHNLHIKAGGK